MTQTGALASGSLPNLSDRDALWRLLLKMTANQAIDQLRRDSRAKKTWWRRNVGCSELVPAGASPATIESDSYFERS